MRTQAAFFGCCLLFLATAVAAPGGVTVNFVNPRHYTDAGHHGRDTEHNLRVLRSDLEDLGARCLAAGETLDIQVMDVDLAGCQEWWHRAGWGKFKLRINIPWSQVMTSTVLDIKRWGNNLGVRLPAAIAHAAHLHADQRVHITVEGERVIITPIRDEVLTLEQRLARFDPERHGGEAMATDEALGTERW